MSRPGGAKVSYSIFIYPFVDLPSVGVSKTRYKKSHYPNYFIHVDDLFGRFYQCLCD